MTADTQGSVPVASPHGRLAGVVENLVRARRRSDVTTFLHGATTSLVIGLALFCLLELMYGVLGGLAPLLSFEWLSVPAWLADWRPGAVPQHLVIAVIGGVAALIVAQFTAISRRPGVGSMAQAADRRFALDERLSTALELAHAPTSSVGVVGEALLQDAARHSEVVDTRRLAPIRLPKRAFAVPILAAIAVLIANSPPTPLLESSPTRASSTDAVAVTMTEAERLDIAGDLRSIAAILAQDGEERADPVLQAIASELNRLGFELEANPQADRAGLADELERLLDLAAEAYARAGVGEDDAGNHARLVQTALNEVDPERAAAAADAAALNPELAEEAANDFEMPLEGVALEGGDLGDGNALALPPGLVVWADQITPGEGAGIRAEIRGGLGEDDNPYEEGDIGGVPAPAEGELIGAGEGLGDDRPGIGDAALFGPDGRPIDPALVVGEMMLIDPDPADGRMLRFNLPPLEQLMGVATDGLEAGDGWRAFNEQEVKRAEVPAQDREVVGRYFQAIMAGPGE